MESKLYDLESSKNYFEACEHILYLSEEKQIYETQVFDLNKEDMRAVEINNMDFQVYLENRMSDSENELLKLFYLSKLYELYKTNRVTDKLRDIQINFLDKIFEVYSSENFELEGFPFANIVKDYLELLSSLLGKNQQGKIIEKLIELLENTSISKETYNSLCESNIFSCIKNENDKKKLFTHVIDRFNSFELAISDMDALECLIIHSAKYQTISNQISNMYFDSVFQFIESLTGIQKVVVIKQALAFTEYHEASKEVRNKLLFEVLKAVPEIKASQEIQHVEFSEQSMRQYQQHINNKKTTFENYDSITCLRYISDKLFNFINEQPSDIEHQFHISQIVYQLTTDDDGLPLHDVHTLEDKFFEKYKQQLIINLNYLILPVFEGLEQKECFNTTLKTINIFDENSESIMLDIMSNFINQEYFSFFSKAVPLIERRLRLFLRQFGEADIKTNSEGGFDYKTMSAFFESSIIREKFTVSSIYVLKLIYDDRRGLNFRNKLAHGLFGFDEIQKLHAVTVLLTLVFIDEINETHNVVPIS